jgi:hypothetical protein
LQSLSKTCFIFTLFFTPWSRYFHCEVIYSSIANEEEHICTDNFSNFTDFTCNCAFNQWLIYFTWSVFRAVWLKSIQEFKCEKHVCFLCQNLQFLFTTQLFKTKCCKIESSPNSPIFLQMIYWVILLRSFSMLHHTYLGMGNIQLNNMRLGWRETVNIYSYFFRYFLICQYICGGVSSKSEISRSAYATSWPTF